ncbi:NAD(P)-dependent dehydrogenase (short-subunit alcohol dehydrogenase family) [Hydrogenispora ethanolica]|uniref:NAD(P)-dependent dehydrogenase (Short-subunit alcohol dehydrogenase family) n=1 Tax=Hydrogenispora ethanolica TaxID=1082276 RepID=A0A4R1RAF2_HYDET|nr:glucose 1-dehydrogenase [Hydrogenispora ethanolica]TCL62733.1 NAD(P)-dependent dehydrogenase (short-subunit alcohol dehydrogenase family) [Hydrogenispora ethanolica]
MRFSNKVVLITGAGSGIGQATAIQFAKAGARVAVNDLFPERAAKTVDLVRNAGGTGLAVPADVADAAAAAKMVNDAVQAFGRIDILVNNAGIILPGRVDDMAEEDFDRTMRINVKGPFLVSKYVVQEMRKTGGGVIVNNASVAALKGIVDRSAYSASKGALVSLTKAMAADYIKENIRVNCVCPGTTYTPALEERMQAQADPEAARAAFIARQPMGRLGKDEEIAQAILFACCDEASYMNGSVVVIDGGATL